MNYNNSNVYNSHIEKFGQKFPQFWEALPNGYTATQSEKDDTYLTPQYERTHQLTKTTNFDLESSLSNIKKVLATSEDTISDSSDNQPAKIFKVYEDDQNNFSLLLSRSQSSSFLTITSEKESKQEYPSLPAIEPNS